jgi:hypothetical protein
VGIASALVVAACGGSAVSHGGPDLVRAPQNESLGRGAWRGQEGIFEPYRHGAHYAVLFTVKNASSRPVTLLSAGDPQPGHRLLRRIGVRFTPVPHHDPRIPEPGLAPPFEAEDPAPLTVPPGRNAWVQFNFVMGECQFFAPGEEQTYNETATIVYQRGKGEKTIALDLTGDQVTITAPSDRRCPAG